MKEGIKGFEGGNKGENEGVRQSVQEYTGVLRRIQESIKESDSQCLPIVSVPPLSCQPLLVTAMIGQLTSDSSDWTADSKDTA